MGKDCEKSDSGGQGGIATLFIFLMLLESDGTRFCKRGVPGRARATFSQLAQNMHKICNFLSDF